MPPSNRQMYEPKVRAAARKYGVPEDVLVAMIAQESQFNPSALNAESGAAGIAQFMPATAKELGIDPMNADQAIDASARYLKQLIDYFDGDIRKGVAAYNFGIGNVDGVSKASKVMGQEWHELLPEETKTYMQSVFGSAGSTPAITGSQQDMTSPLSIDDFTFTDEFGNTVTDWEGYFAAEAARRELYGEDEGDSLSLADALDFVIADLGARIEAGQLDLNKANSEFQRRLSAWESAGKDFENLLGYAVPVDAEYVPGREPGGFYEKMGLTPRRATGPMRDPFAEALDIVNSTPSPTSIPTPTMSPQAQFEAARALQDQVNNPPPPPPPAYGTGNVSGPPSPTAEQAAFSAAMEEERKRRQQAEMARWAATMGGA